MVLICNLSYTNKIRNWLIFINIYIYVIKFLKRTELRDIVIFPECIRFFSVLWINVFYIKALSYLI